MDSRTYIPIDTAPIKNERACKTIRNKSSRYPLTPLLNFT